tara:strand:+ start:35 stop:1087 length:1053 start_codon:yes stop_codon:yes gene_type:complete
MPSLDWKLSSYSYNLPESLIAQHPTSNRDQSRMLFIDRSEGIISHRKFYEIITLLPKNSCLVLNNTKVLPVRLPGKRETGASIEALLIEEIAGKNWRAILRKAGRIREGERLNFCGGKICATALERKNGGEWILEFETPDSIKERLEKVGLIPLPPYIKRDNTNENQNIKDKERYQTCFATNPGAIAAPTAGLHFTTEILDSIKDRGIEILEVTLHVGLGTFNPIKKEDIRDHHMHAEYFSISSNTLSKLQSFKKLKKPIICTGTTSVRVLETLALNNYEKNFGWTDLFIYPPYKFRLVQGLLTNFHLPKSTLLMMVSAFYGREKLLEAYRSALDEKYRFFSFGDCMFIL